YVWRLRQPTVVGNHKGWCIPGGCTNARRICAGKRERCHKYSAEQFASKISSIQGKEKHCGFLPERWSQRYGQTNSRTKRIQQYHQWWWLASGRSGNEGLKSGG